MPRSTASEETTQGDDELSIHADEKSPTPAQAAPARVHLWHHSLAGHRATYRKPAIGLLVVLTVVVWTAFALYWSSSAWMYYHVPDLKAVIINRDAPSPLLPTLNAGATISSALLATTTQTPHTANHGRLWLGWEEVSNPDEWDLNRLRSHVYDENAWVGVFVAPNTSALLVDALNGIANGYNPMGAVTVVYNQARNEIVAGSFILPLTQAVLAKTSAQLSTQFAAAWLQNVSRSTFPGVNMAATLQGVNPQLLTNGITYTIQNLHGVDQPLSNVFLFVSMIYMIVLSFLITMMQNAVMEPLKTRATTWSYAAFRLTVLITYYFIISAMLMLLSLAFGANFNRYFGHAGPVMVWMALFMGMLAVGLAIDAIAQLLPVPALPLFFIVWLVSQLSVLTIPFDLQPAVFQYGVIMPGWAVMRLVRTIVFGNHRTLGQNYGTLAAWLVVNLGTNLLGHAVRAKRELAAEKRH